VTSAPQWQYDIRRESAFRYANIGCRVARFTLAVGRRSERRNTLADSDHEHTGRAQIIAEIGRVVVAEEGPLVLVIDRGTGPSATIAFVLCIFALVLGRGDTERRPSPYAGQPVLRRHRHP
jgi:hypothetical protein